MRRLFDGAVAVAVERRTDLWAVGGVVRDCAAGLAVRDLDLAVAAPTPGAVAAFARAIAQRVDGTVHVRGAALGTAAVETPVGVLDLAALRSERYARPGVLPTATLGASLADDLARRDFTVNAIALGLAGADRGRLVDPLGGLDDLAARRLRVLHDRSFIDDATRLWRGSRLAAQHRLRPDAVTAALIADGARWLAPISGERLYAEFRLTAARRELRGALQRLERWGVLRGTHPSLTLHPATDRALARHPGPHAPELALALLLAPLPGRAAALARLRPPRAARAAVDAAAGLLAAGADAAAVAEDPERLAPLSGAVAGAAPVARLAARWLEPRPQARLQRALRRWERTRPHLDAPALLRLGVPPGPEVGRLLGCLRRERYLGNLSTAAQARALVREELATAYRAAPGGQTGRR